MSLSYRCRWVGWTVPFKRIRYVFTEMIVSLQRNIVNSFLGFFGIFILKVRKFAACRRRKRLHTALYPCLQRRFQRGDQQIAGDHAILRRKAVCEVGGVKQLSVRGEFVVALPDNQPKAVLV